jgi:hypothetical protein
MGSVVLVSAFAEKFEVTHNDHSFAIGTAFGKHSARNGSRCKIQRFKIFSIAHPYSVSRI